MKRILIACLCVAVLLIGIPLYAETIIFEQDGRYFTVDISWLKKEYNGILKELEKFRFEPKSESDFEKYCKAEDWGCLDENHTMWRVHRTWADWCCPKYIYREVGE